MNLILVHDTRAGRGEASLLQSALTNEPLRSIVLGALSRGSNWRQKGGRNRRFRAVWDRSRTICAIPKSWQTGSWQNQEQKRPDTDVKSDVIWYDTDVPLGAEPASRAATRRRADSWFTISNGRFVTKIDHMLLERVLADAGADLVAINAEPALLGARERIRLTTERHVAGFRRTYSDSVQWTSIPADWPHHLSIRASVLRQILEGMALPLSFSALSRKCQSEGLKLRAVGVGGAVLDLEMEDGLLSLCSLMLSEGGRTRVNAGVSSLISRDARLIGKVLLGENVSIGPEAVIVGPTIVGKDAKIERGAVISSSIIGPQVCVPENQLVRDCIVEGSEYDWDRAAQRRGADSHREHDLSPWQTARGAFRNWPRLSYARCFKRVADFVAALMVLILFAPVIPFVALAIKLTSPGPVFYADKRQGLHGKKFGCLKFRTMVTGADKIQDKLRFVSQVDGPQFKMEDDPRISTVGRFLRETYIDEIPQFFNVLFGQMSIVGPRPSPESENTLCPYWRDARLSVRPGITGLWQLHRTREPMRDFQEWIHYDTMYVRNLSLKTDLVTCWQTAMKLLDNFISQF